MAFDKRTFNKTLKNHFTSLGYTPHKNRKDYFVDCADGIARIVVRIPDGKSGFEIGAQFADRNALTENMTNILVVWNVCNDVLADAETHNYNIDKIAASAKSVTDALSPYIIGGKELIRYNMNDFYENDEKRWIVPYRKYNEKLAEEAQNYFGFPPIDIYSKRYREHSAKELCENLAMTRSLEMQEYSEHKDFYDGYADLGCTVEPITDIGRVWIRGKRP